MKKMANLFGKFVNCSHYFSSNESKSFKILKFYIYPRNSMWFFVKLEFKVIDKM